MFDSTSEMLWLPVMSRNGTKNREYVQHEISYANFPSSYALAVITIFFSSMNNPQAGGE